MPGLYLTPQMNSRHHHERTGECYLIFSDTKQQRMALAHGDDDWSAIKNAALTAGASFRSLFSFDYEAWHEWAQKDSTPENGWGQPKLGDFPADVPYTAKSIVIDVDGEALGLVAPQVKHLCEWMDRAALPFRLWHSGKKGFHIEIPREAVGYEPSVDLAWTMKKFVKRFLQYVGERTGRATPPIDDSLYNRTRKIRLPADPRGEIAGHPRFKSPLTPELVTPQSNWGWDCCTTQPDNVGTMDRRYIDPCPMLQEIWQDAKQDVRPVEVHDQTSLARPSRKREFTNLQGLIAEVESQPSAERDADGWINLRCPNPEHDDLTPSAGVRVDNGVCHCFKCGNFSPQQLAAWLGYALEEKDHVDEDEVDESTSLEDARTRLMREMRGSLYGDGNHVWRVSVGVGKSWTMRRLAVESDPTVVLEEGQWARTLGEDDIPDEVLAKIGLEDLSENPADHPWLPNWAQGAAYIDWDPQQHRCFAFMADSYDLLREQFGDLEIGIPLDKPWELEPGCLTEEMGHEGRMPTRAEEIEWRESIGETRASVCATCPLNPSSDAWDPEDDLDPCGYQKRRQELFETSDVVWLPKAYLGVPTKMKDYTEQATHIIVDEDIIPYLMKAISLDAHRLRDVEASGVELPWGGDGETKRIGEVIARLLDGEMPLGENAGQQVIERWASTASWETRDPEAGVWGTDDRIMTIGNPDADEQDIGFDDMELNEEAQQLVAFLRHNLLTGVHVEDGTLWLQGAADWTDYLKSCSLQVLDASLDDRDELLLDYWLAQNVQAWTESEWNAERERRIERKEKSWADENDRMVGMDYDDKPCFEERVPEEPPGGWTKSVPPSFHSIQLHTSETTIVHDPSSLFSRNGKSNLLSRHSEPDPTDPKSKFDRMGALIDFIDELVRDAGPENVGIISHKPQEDGDFIHTLFSELETDQLNIDDDFLYYGNLRGMDQMKDRDNVVIIGDPSVPEQAFQDEMMRMWGRPYKPYSVPHLERFRWERGEREWPTDVVAMDQPHTVRDGSYTLHYKTLVPQTEYETKKAGVSLTEYCWDRLITREIYQAIGRARGHSNPSTIYLLSARWPGEVAKGEFSYVIDEELLVSKSSQARHVDSIDMSAHEEARRRVRKTVDSISGIMRDTNLSRSTIEAKRTSDSWRARVKEVCWVLSDEGVTQKRLADHFGVSTRQVRRWIKSVDGGKIDKDDPFLDRILEGTGMTSHDV